MDSNNLKFFASVIFCVSLLYYVFYLASLDSYPVNRYDRLVSLDEDESEFYYDETNNLRECQPFLANVSQYQVQLDGRVYPQISQLHLSQTINFECLNRSRNTKKILLWNGFFGDNSFGYGLGQVVPFVKNSCPVTSCEILNDKVSYAYFI
jgi:hypothetical protein